MNIIIDTGAWVTKVGIANDDEPKTTISTLYGNDKNDEQGNYLIGDDL